MSDKIGKCKTCKNWKRETDRLWNNIETPTDPDTYDKSEMPFEVRKCQSDNITLFERNPNSNGISLNDGSAYFAAMYTGEDFGCVLYEPNK